VVHSHDVVVVVVVVGVYCWLPNVETLSKQSFVPPAHLSEWYVLMTKEEFTVPCTYNMYSQAGTCAKFHTSVSGVLFSIVDDLQGRIPLHLHSTTVGIGTGTVNNVISARALL
jgi:hypothetical protein